MRLYELDWSIYPRRVIIYLAEKSINDIDRVSVDLLGGESRQPAFLALNPSGTVPVLEVRPGVVIRQSMAIMEYLEETRPQQDMIGDTPEKRAATRDLMCMINDCYIYLLNYFGHSSPIFARMIDQKADAAAAFHARYRRAIGEIEQVIGGGEFLCDDRLTIADCMMFASAQFADRLYGEPLPPGCAKLNTFYLRFGQRPAAAAPEYPELLKRVEQGE